MREDMCDFEMSQSFRNHFYEQGLTTWRAPKPKRGKLPLISNASQGEYQALREEIRQLTDENQKLSAANRSLVKDIEKFKKFMPIRNRNPIQGLKTSRSVIGIDVALLDG